MTLSYYAHHVDSKLTTSHARGKAKDAFKAGIKYKPPRPLLNSIGKNWVFQPHLDLYKKLAPPVLDQYATHKSNTNDKSNTPMYFYLGETGPGKSRHGSEFASSVQEAIALYTQDHELGQRLKTAFVFHTSFENGTSLAPEEKSGLYKADGVRMLQQLLGGPLDESARNTTQDLRKFFDSSLRRKKLTCTTISLEFWFNKLLRTSTTG